MEYSLRQLSFFVAVADERSFTQAARKLHVTQPTLSTQVRALEQAMGFDLFIRSTRKVELTSEGRRMLAGARRLVDENEAFRTELKGLRRSRTLTVEMGSAPYTIDIPQRSDLLAQFMGANEHAKLRIDNRWQRELLVDLLDNRLDLLLMIGIRVDSTVLRGILARGEGAETLYPDDLPSIRLKSQPVKLLVPIESDLARLERLDKTALEGRRVAMLAGVHGAPLIAPIRELFSALGADLVVPPEGNAIAVERYGRQFRTPAVSLGWFDEHMPGVVDMVSRPVDGLDLSTDLVLLTRSGGPPAAAEAFWALASTVER